MRQQQHAPSHPFPAVVFLVSFLTYLCAAPHPGYDSGLVDSYCYRASTNKQLSMSTRSCFSSFFPATDGLVHGCSAALLCLRSGSVKVCFEPMLCSTRNTARGAIFRYMKHERATFLGTCHIVLPERFEAAIGRLCQLWTLLSQPSRVVWPKGRPREKGWLGLGNDLTSHAHRSLLESPF